MTLDVARARLLARNTGRLAASPGGDRSAPLSPDGVGRRAFALGFATAMFAAGAVAQPHGARLTTAERALIAGALNLSGDSMSDAALLKRLLQHARVEAGQRLRPSAINPLWTLERPERDLSAELWQAISERRLATWLAGLSPSNHAYRALVTARDRYAALSATGGWLEIPAGPALAEGDRSSTIPVLRRRLAAEAREAQPVVDPTLFDAALARAVRGFQAAYGLEPDGVVGPATRAAMNISAQARLEQIEANLERWRWLPHSLPADRIEVDTGAQEATLYLDDRQALRMRVVVGRPERKTPMFAAVVEAVIVNPVWNVPSSIARNELLPAESRRPGTLARMGISSVDGRLQQRPGPANALGRIKFDMPNRFDVYLHDTPARALFERPVRAFSHGCVRLERPLELAGLLLARQDASPAHLDQAIDAGGTVRLRLARAILVYVTYRTAEVVDGLVRFRPDIYLWDRELSAALAHYQ